MPEPAGHKPRRPTPEQMAGLEKARQVVLDQRAERAIQNPAKLAYAARLFRHALARGLVDADGNVVEPEQAAS